MKKLTKKSSTLQMDDFFRAAPSSVAAIRLNHSASPVQEVSSMFVYSSIACLQHWGIIFFISIFGNTVKK